MRAGHRRRPHRQHPCGQRASCWSSPTSASPRAACIEPKGDSALHYVDLLRAAEPDFDGLGETSALLASRALAESRTALGAGNIDRADQYARAAADAGAPAAEVADLNAKIMSARSCARPRSTAAQEPSVLPENKLRRTFFIAPSYPARARERGTEGWVDLEFTVTKDGTTRDPVVRAAEPAETFDRAALDAVGAGATSRASSTAPSSSSASKRACASSSPINQVTLDPSWRLRAHARGRAATPPPPRRPRPPLPPARCRRRSSTRSQ